jgi:hypothetical protein
LKKSALEIRKNILEELNEFKKKHKPRNYKQIEKIRLEIFS